MTDVGKHANLADQEQRLLAWIAGLTRALASEAERPLWPQPRQRQRRAARFQALLVDVHALYGELLTTLPESRGAHLREALGPLRQALQRLYQRSRLALRFATLKAEAVARSNPRLRRRWQQALRAEHREQRKTGEGEVR